MWKSKGIFLRNRYFSSPFIIYSGSTSCCKRAAELCSSSSWSLEGLGYVAPFCGSSFPQLNMQEAAASLTILSLMSNSLPQDWGACKQQEKGGKPENLQHLCRPPSSCGHQLKSGRSGGQRSCLAWNLIEEPRRTSEGPGERL